MPHATELKAPQDLGAYDGGRSRASGYLSFICPRNLETLGLLRLAHGRHALLLVRVVVGHLGLQVA